MNTNPEPTPADVEKVARSIFEQLQAKYTDDQWQSYDKLEESEREFARELARAAITALSSLPSEREQIVAWQPIETAPKDGTAFQAKIPGHGADNVIAWTDGLLDANEKFCGTWAFVTEQEPPDCWTDGCCWAVNEDGVPSVQPTEWKPLPAPPRAHLPTTEQEEG